MARPNLRIVRPQHTLLYGLHLVRGETLEDPAAQGHVRLNVPRPDGGTETLTLHSISGDLEEIRARLHESVDAFFEILREELA